MFPILKLDGEYEIVVGSSGKFAELLLYWFAISPFPRDQTSGPILFHNGLFPLNIEAQHSFRFGEHGHPLFTLNQAFKQSVGCGCSQWS
jgi:hypothetical protein